jgi:predicted RecB family nuclease
MFLLRGTEIDACRHRVILARTPEIRALRSLVTPEIARRQRDATQHRSRIEEVLKAQSHVVAHDEASTQTAMSNGRELILSPRLSSPNLRVDLSLQALIRTGKIDDTYTYTPLIIKNHEVVESSTVRSLTTSEIDDLRPGSTTEFAGVGLRSTATVRRDGLLLSAAWLVLDEDNHADPQHRGVVIDRQSRAWWIYLDGPGTSRFGIKRCAELLAERRLDLNAFEDDRITTEPYWHRDCDTCDFAPVCEEILLQRDDVSLVRFTNEEQQQLLRERGITTRHALAGLSPANVDAGRNGNEETLEGELVGSIERLDDLIYRARSAVAKGPLRIVESEALACPRADIEVDVDMEGYDGLTYLWGATVTSRVVSEKSRHESFVHWGELTSRSEAVLFSDFWSFVRHMRDEAATQGHTITFYCFWAAAENEAMRRAAGDRLEEVNSFLASSQWVDMHEVVARQIQTEGPTGLKQMAQYAGFSWRDDNPSGEASMLWYESAIASEEVDTWRNRILIYNEDDCRATRALRDWIMGPARELPSRDDPRWEMP